MEDSNSFYGKVLEQPIEKEKKNHRFGSMLTSRDRNSISFTHDSRAEAEVHLSLNSLFGKGRNDRGIITAGHRGGAIGVYIVKSIFDGMKKTYMVESQS